MATVALQTVGFAFAGPVGGAVGGLLGGFLDSLLLDALSPTQTQKGPRLSSIDITTAQEGSPIPRVYSKRVRVERTNLLWINELETVKITESVGSGTGS